MTAQRMDGVREYREGWTVETDSREVGKEQRAILRGFVHVELAVNGFVLAEQAALLKGDLGEGGGHFATIEIDLRDLVGWVQTNAPHLLEPELEEG